MQHLRVLISAALLSVLPAAGVALGSVPVAAQGGPLPVWLLEPTAVEVGAETPDSPALVVSGAAFLSDGRIVVADSGGSRVGVFTRSGARLTTFGRPGTGPGEFTSVTSVESGAGDSIFVFDGGLQRLSVHTPDGSLVRVTLVAQNAGLRVGAVGRLGPDRWYAKEAPRLLPSGVGRARASVVLLGGGLQTIRQVTSVPDLITGSVTMAGQVATRFAPFSPRALDAHAGPCFFVTASDDGRVSVFRADGSQGAAVSAPASPRRVTPADKSAWVEEAVRGLPPQTAAAARGALLEFPHPPSFPRFHDMVADDHGYLWLQEFAPPLGPGGRWIVLGRRGAVARVELPDADRILAIRGSTVAARVPLAPGRATLRLYTLGVDRDARSREDGLCPEEVAHGGGGGVSRSTRRSRKTR
jgi:hypothetical protein